MFESLSEKLQGIFRRLNSKGILTEKDVDEALREVRLALLEADVHFKVARDLVARLREQAVGAAVLQSLTPGQQVIKLVHQELTGVLGERESRLEMAAHPPTVVMLVGLQGSGKTTTAAKLGLHLRRGGQQPWLVAADVRRPAAIAQLVTLGKQLDLPVYAEEAAQDPPGICLRALRRAREAAASHLLLDTQGRLHIDEAMMGELRLLKERLQPSEVLLVADAMTGQDAVRVAEAFQSQVGLTGLILTKLDGDARGGAALSMRAVTGVPIKFIGTGEKPEALEPLHPQRLASRILGMGDVLGLIERAQATVDARRTQELQKRLRRATFDLADFLEQLREVKKMGPLDQLLELIPGFSALRGPPAADRGRMPGPAVDERDLKRAEAIICSMTPWERRHPELIDGSRRRRIARGSGTTPQEINQLLNQFRQTQKLIKQMAQGRLPGAGRLFR